MYSMYLLKMFIDVTILISNFITNKMHAVYDTHLSKHATLKHFCCRGCWEVETCTGSLSCKMELMKVPGERGVSTGKLDIGPTSTLTGHSSSSSSKQWTGLDGSSLMWTNGLVLFGQQIVSPIITGQLHSIKNLMYLACPPATLL